MEILTTPSEIEKKTCSLMDKYKTISLASTWASANSKVFKVLMKNKNKINVAGKHMMNLKMYQVNDKMRQNIVKLLF